MSLLGNLGNGNSETKEDQFGVVKEVYLVSAYDLPDGTKVNSHSSIATDHKGSDENGDSITETYISGHYLVYAGKNRSSNIAIEIFGKPPKAGSRISLNKSVAIEQTKKFTQLSLVDKL